MSAEDCPVPEPKMHTFAITAVQYIEAEDEESARQASYTVLENYEIESIEEVDTEETEEGSQ